MLIAATTQALLAQAPVVVNQAPVDPALDITFHATLLPREIYVGQQASYQVGVFIAEDARARLRRNPEFVPPELRAMLGYDLTTPSSFSRMAGNRRYEVHVFQRAIFPLVAGRHAIAPARLSYSLPLSTSFFSREESRTLRSESLAVIAREPPQASRPGDFTGAVGTLTLERRVDGARARVGDPLVMTLVVRGVGNVSLLPRPNVRLTWAQVVNGPERVQIDTSGSMVRGAKEFDFIVTPTGAGAQTLPAVRYAFFDPYAERYAAAVVPEVALAVASGSVITATAATAESPEPLAIRASYRGAMPLPVTSYATFWLALAAVPLPAASLALVRRAKRRRVEQTGYVLRHFGSTARDLAAVRRALTAALGERLNVDAAVLADSKRIVRALRRRGVTRETALETARLHTELDAAVFGGATSTPDASLGSRAAQVFEAIDREATRRRGTLRKTGIASALLLAAVTPLAFALQGAASDAEAFAHGVALYNDGAYLAAQRVFGSIAAAEPRAADAWANAGTSAWQAHDTAAAAVSWQRALRLDPTDAETRERLGSIPSFEHGVFGDVPPLPLSLMAWIGAALWFVTWSMQPIRRRWASFAAGTAFVASIAALLYGMRLHEIATGRRAAVVIASERLRNTPSLGADLGEGVLVGETVRTPTARTTWTFVRLKDGREGWLPTDRLVSLEQRN